MGGSTAVSIKSERILATTSEETRRIMGWRLACETAPVFLAELRSTFSGIAGSWIGDVSESAASKYYSQRQFFDRPLALALAQGQWLRPFNRAKGSVFVPSTGSEAVNPFLQQNERTYFAAAQHSLLRGPVDPHRQLINRSPNQPSGSIAFDGVGRSVICWPNRLPISSTAVRAGRPRAPRNGLVSTLSAERTSPESCIISMTRCASRYVAPPGTVVPTPGARWGSRKSTSKLTCSTPFRACTLSMPRRISTPTPNSSI